MWPVGILWWVFSPSLSPPPLRTDSELVMPLSHYYCKDAYEASMKCLETNGYDLAKCKHMQDLYKQCKKQEVETRETRRKEAAATTTTHASKV